MGMLAAKAQPIELVIAQARPQLALCRGKVMAQLARPVEGFRRCAFMSHFYPTPALPIERPPTGRETTPPQPSPLEDHQ